MRLADATAPPAAPRYPHDCTSCRYLGHVLAFDLYVCPQGGLPTVVARYGAEGPAYASGPDVRLDAVLGDRDLTLRLATPAPMLATPTRN
jgi:hypothetical protein